MKLISQILKKVSDSQKLILNTTKVEHGPTIGSMYEGLTKDILKNIDFTHPDLNVVSGFIKVGDNLSGQIDCMVVIGAGEKIPFTDNFIYPIDQVIAVFEVKKSLFSKDLADAYEHLNKVFELSKEHYKRQQDAGTLNFSTERAAYEFLNLFGEFPPHYSANTSLPFHQRTIYHSLVRDWLTPLRIAIGYNGFKSEKNLRNALIKFYDDKIYAPGYGIQNMPNLMISDGYSIIKMNGMPYQGGWDDTDGWIWLASSSANPILLIMELLFDRIELLLNVSPDRGTDLHQEGLIPLAVGMPTPSENSGAGWKYTMIRGMPSSEEARDQEWAPLKITNTESKFLKLLYQIKSLHIKDVNLSKFLHENGIYDVLEFSSELRKVRVVLLVNDVFSICSGDWFVTKIGLQIYCGNDSGGRFQQWISLNAVPPWRLDKVIKISP